MPSSRADGRAPLAYTPPVLPSSTALLVIDVQQGFSDPRWGVRNNPEAEQRIADLLHLWRGSRRPVIHVQHLSREAGSPLAPGTPGVEIQEIVRPRVGERLVRKHVNSAFIGTDLEESLHAEGIGTLVATGLTTDHCVSTTVRMAGNLGFRTFVVADATATFGKRGFDGAEYDAELIHETALASLHGEFAEVVTFDELVARL